MFPDVLDIRASSPLKLHTHVSSAHVAVYSARLHLANAEHGTDIISIGRALEHAVMVPAATI